MMLKETVYLMGRLGFGRILSGYKLRNGVQTGWYFLLLLISVIIILLRSFFKLRSMKFLYMCILRPKGTWELKPADKVDRNKSREYLVKYVLPAIKLKWPESDRWNTIYVQQDNAKTHILPDDPLFVQEAARGG
jgi:hypothetical protein